MTTMPSNTSGVALTDDILKEIGQHFIVGFHGASTEPSEDITRLLQAPYYVGGIILMKRNLKDAQQIRALIRNLQQVAKSAGQKRPLVIGTDQEGGLVAAMTKGDKGCTQFPGAMALGLGANDVVLTEKVYAALGKELKLLGIDWVFAPVADVNSDTRNPVIGVRSFGINAHMVAKHVGAAVTGIQNSGVAACLKHFPGHGDTHVDSHLERPYVKGKGVNELEHVELVPFREGIQNGVGSVMTGHLVLSEFGDEVCSLEQKVITGLLRERCAYDGVIVTDCLEMDAVSETSKGGCGVPEASVRALVGGTDVAMICHRLDRHVGGIEAVWEAVKSGRIKLDNLIVSGERISRMKEQFKSVLWQDDGEWQQEWDGMKQEHKLLSKEAYSKTVRVLRPGSQIQKDEKVTLFTPAVESLNRAVDDTEEIQRSKTGDVRNTAGASYLVLAEALVCEKHIVYGKNYAVAEEDIPTAGRVVFVLRNADQATWQKEVLEKVMQAVSRSRMVIVSSCNPFDGETVDIETLEFTAEGLMGVVLYN